MANFDTVLLIVALVAGAVGLLSMGVGWIVDAWDRLRGVNTFDEGAAEIMSGDEDEESAIGASSLGTGPDRTQDRTAAAAARRRKLLDTYRMLRAHNMSRKDAQALLHMWDIPLSNDLWSQAAPPPPGQVTPIAQRPTNATFQDDPELEYKPL